LRPGERMIEEFWDNDEHVVEGPHEKIWVVSEPGFEEVPTLTSIEMLRSYVSAGKREGSVRLLRTLVTTELENTATDLVS
jgi:FlaA1/EpsC-like NDP-sugar epimerase